MTPTEQDKLREQVHKLFGDYQADDGGYQSCYDGKWIDMTNEVCAVADYITAENKRVTLEARIDEMKLHRHEWALFGDRPPYEGESVSLPILLAYHDDRIAELKAQQEEV